ncbi:hypothetical protein PISMIDRAFT_678535, partial [Pisolithus microcarpus 441]
RWIRICSTVRDGRPLCGCSSLQISLSGFERTHLHTEYLLNQYSGTPACVGLADDVTQKRREL